MKVIVDMDLCQDHGQCAIAAPEVFRINDDGHLEYDGTPDGTYLAGQEERITTDARAICESDAIRDLLAVFSPDGPVCDYRDRSLDIGPASTLAEIPWLDWP